MGRILDRKTKCIAPVKISEMQVVTAGKVLDKQDLKGLLSVYEIFPAKKGDNKDQQYFCLSSD